MIIHYERKEVKLPDFLIVGAQKSGTTSLHHYLKQYSQIFMSPIKEPFFFSFVNNPPNYSDPGSLFEVIYRLEDYINLFKDSETNELIGESSTSYLYMYEETIKNIKIIYGEDYNKLKIIIILRNPVERAYSQFVMYKRDYLEPSDFKHAFSLETIDARLNNNWNIFFDYISVGLYFSQVKAYLNDFPKVKILFYDDLVKNHAKVMKDLCDFLKIDYRDDLRLDRHNRSGVPRVDYINKLLNRPSQLKDFIKGFLPGNVRQKIRNKISEINLKPVEMSKQQRKYLSSIYREDINNLSKLLKKDLSKWLV